jgi:transcriptional regulator with XRE-family HTH domain
MRRIVSGRLVAARELNGLTQTQAAEEFGYKTSAQLSLWEMNRRMPPLEKLVQASAVYRVSLDFLLGVSEEPDRDAASAERRMVLAANESLVRDVFTTLTDAIMAQAKAGQPAVLAAMAIVEEGDALVKSLRRFMAANSPHFEEDMRSSANLQHAAESFEANALAPARAQIARYARINHTSVQRAIKPAMAALDLRTRSLLDPEAD